MPLVIPVKFTFAMRDLWFDPAESGAKGGDRVVCVTERGTELGVAVRDPFEVSEEELSETIGDAELKQIERVATEEDLIRADELAIKGSEALPVFKKLAKESGLDMKPVGVEYLFGGERAICYFVADERVDFRQLVRDLSRALHERIDMRQIGVREEASLMGGYAHCGQELCCARLGVGFEPVSIRMAKEQDLPLNSPKISGQCGRLMCCLRYEFEAYKDFKSRAPKRNATVETPLGDARVVDFNTPKEEVGMRLENGKTMHVPLAGMSCSECARKRAEENGCCCRPDQVPRATLDALAAPDIQLALSELDRENGVVAEPENNEDLVLVSESRKRRNRERNVEKVYEVEITADEETIKSKRRRRRRGNADDAPKQEQVETRQPRQRARQEQPAVSEQLQRTTRRRHHSADDAAASVESENARTPRKPGDKGGSASEQQPRRRRKHATLEENASGPDQPSKPRRERKERPQQKKPREEGKKSGADQQKASKDEGAKPKRRRSRGGRGRKPKQGGEGSPDQPKE